MGEPIAPLWLVVPLAGIAMVTIAGYIIALREAPDDRMPPLRRRIRTATAWLSLTVVPLTAHGFAIATTNELRVFLLVWLLATFLLALILILALIDLWILAVERRRLLKAQRDEVRRVRRELARLASNRSDDGA
ncbi:MAG: hypothetical protein ACF8Q5_02765 [Phycisphaerales bacterium JB040]